jgi:hypothetical protein
VTSAACVQSGQRKRTRTTSTPELTAAALRGRHRGRTASLPLSALQTGAAFSRSQHRRRPQTQRCEQSLQLGAPCCERRRARLWLKKSAVAALLLAGDPCTLAGRRIA